MTSSGRLVSTLSVRHACYRFSCHRPGALITASASVTTSLAIARRAQDSSGATTGSKNHYSRNHVLDFRSCPRMGREFFVTMRTAAGLFVWHIALCRLHGPIIPRTRPLTPLCKDFRYSRELLARAADSRSGDWRFRPHKLRSWRRKPVRHNKH